MKTYLSLLFLFLSVSYCSAQKLLLKGELSTGKTFFLSYDETGSDHVFYWGDSEKGIPLEVLPVKSSSIVLREKVQSNSVKVDEVFDLVSFSLYKSSEQWSLKFTSENYEKVKLQEI